MAIHPFTHERRPAPCLNGIYEAGSEIAITGLSASMDFSVSITVGPNTLGSYGSASRSWSRIPLPVPVWYGTIAELVAAYGSPGSTDFILYKSGCCGTVYNYVFMDDLTLSVSYTLNMYSSGVYTCTSSIVDPPGGAGFRVFPQLNGYIGQKTVGQNTANFGLFPTVRTTPALLPNGNCTLDVTGGLLSGITGGYSPAGPIISALGTWTGSSTGGYAGGWNGAINTSLTLS